ncbi:MAG: hypothetical protein ACJ705_01230 [Nitrososphaeraceae archaeon]|jgi:hypothetical protein
MDIISMFSIQKAKEKLADCNVLLKYMAFLQNNGFSDYGKGQIMGQVALLKEYLEDGVEQKERDKEESKDSILTDNNKMYKDKKVVEQQIVTTKDNTLYEQAGEKIAETIFRKGISNLQNNNNNNNKSGLLKGVENIIDKARDIRILE